MTADFLALFPPSLIFSSSALEKKARMRKFLVPEKRYIYYSENIILFANSFFHSQ